MSPTHRPYRYGISREEEKLWIGFYQRIHRDPTLANELLTLMKHDAVMRREHLALYLCCRESLRIAQQRQLRDQQIARVVNLVLLGPWRALRRAWRRGGDIAVQCLPEMIASAPPRPEPLPPPKAVSARKRRSSPAGKANGNATPTEAV